MKAKILLQNLRAPLENTAAYAEEAAEKKLKKAGIHPYRVTLSKKSIDARRKRDIFYICSVTAEVEKLPSEATLRALDAVVLREAHYDPIPGAEPLKAPVAVVGFGPCGMFAALALAERGYRPLVLERGGCVAERTAAVERFTREQVLLPDCNIQFGAGGAGTFSDGKLVTRKNDAICSYVLKRLVEFGAPADILVNARPHVGTDLLKRVVESIAARVTSLGGTICYNTRAEAFLSAPEGIRIQTTAGDFQAGAVVLAIGHSARDTYEYLYRHHVTLQPKAFSVGVRIEHRKEDINRAMYGDHAEKLPPAEYNLSLVTGERGVYSFCMCPGGQVVAAASESGGVVTNGMSDHARNGNNSNAALAVSVLPGDYGHDPMKAIAFQRELEKAAFAAGGSTYAAPISTVGDFLSDRIGQEPTRIQPTYMGGEKVALCDLNRLLPPFVSSMLKRGIVDFGKKIRGFDTPDAILTGVETRTSAPLRILRGDSLEADAMPRLYPCGEGAGYAGGITSAAVDGLRTAAAIIERFKPLE